MSSNKNSFERMGDKSLIDLAKLIMSDERKEMNFNDMFTRVAKLKGLSEQEKDSRISQFYTDLNANGNFVTNGANIWGLKQWYKSRDRKIEKQATKLSATKKDVEWEKDEDIEMELKELGLPEELEELDDYDGDIEFEEDA